MAYETFIVLSDVIGTIGFLIATAIGIQNYRLTDVERPFWLAFSVTAALGAIWLALVTAEWLGFSSELLNSISTSLQAVVIGLFTIGVIGTYTLVRDLKRSHMETAHRASIVSILSRVFRHNLRNDLTAIRGFTEMFVDDSEEAEIVQRKVDDLIDTTEKARKLEQTIISQPHFDDLELNELLDRTVEEISTAYPAATIAIDGPSGVTVPALPSLPTALAELIENAAQHAGSAPNVSVTIDSSDAGVTLHISDDGPGLPERERTLLDSGIETPLLHSTGIGLWVAQWIINTHDGEITSATNEDGTTLSVVLPKRSVTQTRDRSATDSRIRPGYDRYHSIFENDLDATLVFDDDCRILDANDGASTLFSTPRLALLGRPIDEILPDECAVGVHWADLEMGEAVTGTTSTSELSSRGEAIAYMAKRDIVLGEHLLILRDVARYDETLS